MIRLFQGENYGVGFILVSVGLVEGFMYPPRLPRRPRVLRAVGLGIDEMPMLPILRVFPRTMLCQVLIT